MKKARKKFQKKISEVLAEALRRGHAWEVLSLKH
jgi:hypothetical protein